jgi:signal transduction histidine kinase
MVRQGFISLVLLCFSSTGYAQITQKHIRNYGPEVNKGGEALGAISVDEKGILYFASEKGLLIYDGEIWQVVTLPGELGVRSLEYDTLRHRLWVGGIETFGYLTHDSAHRYRYVGISDSVIKQKPFKQVWQILVEKDVVTFMTNEAHFVWQDQEISIQPIERSYVFLVNGVKYYSQKKGGLRVIEGSTQTDVWDHSTAIRESVYYVTALDENQHLLFTPYDGVFVYHLQTKKVTPYKSPLSKLLRERPFYEATCLNDSLLAIGTWYHGVLITDMKGNLIDEIGTVNGMASDGISDLLLDSFGKLWLATDYGISVVDIKSAWPQWVSSSVRLQTYVNRITINNDSTVFLAAKAQVATFSRKPDHLTFYFSTPGLEYLTEHANQVRLEGYDTTWTSVGDKAQKTYEQLGNGHYVFRVKSTFENGETGEAAIPIYINQPWYALLVDMWQQLVIGASLVFLLLFTLTYRLRSSKKTLTRMVAEKTRAIELHEKELVAMNKSLREANEELDILLYRSSHDLVAPVKSIKGLLNLMRMSPDEHETFVPLMIDRIVRLERILIEINSYVKNAKGEPGKNTFRVTELIQEVWGELEFMDEAREIDRIIEVSETLFIECDRERLKMVISNLLSNAVKYYDRGKAKSFVHIRAGREKNIFWLTIADNGLGIREEYQARLFEMFYRATESSSGLGLGLFLVKKIVHSLKGTIHLDSTHGNGTKVEVRFPAVFLESIKKAAPQKKPVGEAKEGRQI